MYTRWNTWQNTVANLLQSISAAVGGGTLGDPLDTNLLDRIADTPTDLSAQPASSVVAHTVTVRSRVVAICVKYAATPTTDTTIEVDMGANGPYLILKMTPAQLVDDQVVFTDDVLVTLGGDVVVTLGDQSADVYIETRAA